MTSKSNPQTRALSFSRGQQVNACRKEAIHVPMFSSVVKSIMGISDSPRHQRDACAIERKTRGDLQLIKAATHMM
jgi:hypothetical protein